MEGRANFAQQRKVRDEMSRMQLDLSRSNLTNGTVNGASSEGMIRRVLSEGRLPRVCVVGGGMAGLRCAQILSEKGLKVSLFEARSFIGGRVRETRVYVWRELIAIRCNKANNWVTYWTCKISVIGC